MSKDDGLPEIPSWEELGISPEELKELEDELAKEEAGAAGPRAAGGDSAAAPSKAGSAPPEKKPAAPPRGPARARASEPPSSPKAAKRRFWQRRSASSGEGAAASSRAGKARPSGPASPPPPETGATPPSPRLRGPLTVLLLLGLAWMASSTRSIPGPVAADAPDSVFSSERAFQHLERIARAAHPPGSPEHAAVREYLVTTLRGMGLDPEVQTTTEVIGRGSQARAATVRNIVARMPGTGAPGAVLATAHYDGREVSHGAGDDGTGVVALLEAVRALRTGPPLAHDVILLITDAEELGLIGARAFVNQHPWMQDVAVALSFEMRGGGGPAMMFETGIDNGWIVEQYRAASPAPATNSLSFEVYKRLPNDTDFTPFREAGTQGLNFAAIGRAHLYHQEYDRPENLSHATLQHHGVQALALLRHLGNADLSALDAPDRVHFSLPFVGVLTYAPVWSWVLSAALLLLFVTLGLLGQRAGLRMGGVALGTLLSVLAVMGSAAIGWALLQWLPRFHPEAGHLHGSMFHSEGPYVLALALAVTGFTLVLTAVGRRLASVGELALGASILPMLSAVALGVVAPMGAMNLQWPALAMLLAAAVALRVGRGVRPGWVRWILWLALSVPVLAFGVPLVELLWLAMSFGLAAALGGLIALFALMLWPLLDLAREPNGWWSTTVAIVAAAVLIGVGLARARPSPDRPLPSTLLYVMDRGDGSAVWAMDPAARAADATARADLIWEREKGGVPDTVRALPAVLPAQLQYATSPAPPVGAAPIEVALVTDSARSGATAPIQVRVRSALGAEALRFQFPEGGVRPLAINGQPLSGMPGLTTVDHWGTPAADAVVLDLDPVSIRGPVLFTVVETLLRPEELLGAQAFARPPELAPDITRYSDRALIRTPVQIDLSTRGVTLGTGGVAQAPAAGPAPTLEPEVAVELFARDRISTVDPEFATTFSPDGRTLYFNRTDARRQRFALLASLLRGSTWSDPEPVPFAAADGRDIDPFVAPDGDRIWFSSDRPRAGTSVSSFSTWYVERTATGWSAPIDPGVPFNSDSADVFVSQARDGTVVFSSTRSGPRRVYQTHPERDGWAEPVALRFGSLEEASNPLIAPDGSFILLSLVGPTEAAPDLYVTCRGPDGDWEAPRRLPDGINSPFAEFAPALHPVDGALYFTSERPGILGPVPDSIRPPGDLYRADPTWRVPCDTTGRSREPVPGVP
ncbi:MAG: M20/M25/M40 family metallo-hydrolase [Gemmatimonadota bacterium]